MRFYIVNHAHAVPRDQVESMDKRPLSDKGRKDNANLVAFMKKNGEKVDLVYHVDTSWTKENAELFAKEWGGGAKVSATPYPLKSGSDVAPCLEDVNKNEQNIVLAGPSDGCMKIATALLTGGARQEPSAVTLGNGVCACLERGTDGAWTLQWMIRPEQLG
ncbi:MAG: hypothetical protein RIB59_11315 [Rhodospirillales bacterium]